LTNDPPNELASVVRSGTLTVYGSLTGEVAHLAINGKPTKIYSDGSFASVSGFDFINKSRAEPLPGRRRFSGAAIPQSSGGA
jgi:hypothetical protein